jgi:hypothetical protein
VGLGGLRGGLESRYLVSYGDGSTIVFREKLTRKGGPGRVEDKV